MHETAITPKPPIVFIDTEFSSLLDPHLWSIGLVTLDGRECYAELDMASEFGRERLKITHPDVRYNILDKFGVMPEAKCDSEWSLGLRVGTWLLGLAEGSPTGRVELLYEDRPDYELLVGALEECNLWPKARVVASAKCVSSDVAFAGAQFASEATLRAIRHRTPPLSRHHALGDALALRAAWRASHLMRQRTGEFQVLLDVVGMRNDVWLYEWLAVPMQASTGQTPLDLLDQVDGLATTVGALSQAANLPKAS